MREESQWAVAAAAPMPVWERSTGTSAPCTTVSYGERRCTYAGRLGTCLIDQRHRQCADEACQTDCHEVLFQRQFQGNEPADEHGGNDCAQSADARSKANAR